MLDLIDKYIGHFPGDKPLFDVSMQSRRFAQREEIEILQIDRNDLPVFHAVCTQIILEDLQQSGLPAAPNAGDHFDQLLVTKADQFVQIFFSLQSLPCHCKPPFLLTGSISKKREKINSFWNGIQKLLILGTPDERSGLKGES